jgi:hypothetical protein
VDVRARIVRGDVEFSHDWRFENGPSKGGGKIEVPAKTDGDPGTPIHFHLDDDTGLHLKFVPDNKDVMWVDRNGCPESQTWDQEIPIGQIDPSPMLLKVYDKNQEECELHYRLRFQPDPEKYSYDPEIKNGGSFPPGG